MPPEGNEPALTGNGLELRAGPAIVDGDRSEVILPTLSTRPCVSANIIRFGPNALLHLNCESSVARQPLTIVELPGFRVLAVKIVVARETLLRFN